uniref:GCR030 n=1 Tax=Schmidtea mediterranea TaxID=79327 RepID=A0A193KUL8_SCHMD|nr:GCR030 [Schmidtea mediterranea]
MLDESFFGNSSNSTGLNRFDYYLYSQDITYLCINIVLGILFNLCVPFAISVDKKLWISSNFLILNIITVDLMVCCYILPVTLANRILSRNVMGYIGCHVNSFLTFISMGINNFIFMIISFDRYLFIFHKLSHTQLFTISNTLILIALVWLFWIGYGIALSFFKGFGYESDAFVCFILDTNGNIVTLFFLTVFNFLLPISVSTGFYTILLVKLFKTKRNLSIQKEFKRLSDIQRDKNEMRMVVLLIVTVGTFFLCWAPYTFHGFFYRFGGTLSAPLHRVIYWGTLTNATLNGWLFGVMNSRFRKSLKQIFQSKSRKSETLFSTN